VDCFQSQGFSGVPAESTGQFRIRTVSGSDRAASAIREAIEGPWNGRGRELVDDFDGDTYRAVYAARFDTAVYVLHSFKKKSKKGAETPRSDIELIKRRLKDAEADHAAQLKQENKP